MAPNLTNITESTATVAFLQPDDGGGRESIKSKMNDPNNNMKKIDDDYQRAVPPPTPPSVVVTTTVDDSSNNVVGESGTLLVEPGQCLRRSTATIPKTMTNGPAEDYYEATELVKTSSGQVYKPKIRWPDLGAQLFLHIGALYGLYYLITCQTHLRTFLWGMYMYTIN